MRALITEWKYGLAMVGMLVCLMVQPDVFGQVRLEPDGTGNTYELIEAGFGERCYEVPDCSHTAFGRHITGVFDEDLGRHAFVFHIHATPDDDRCKTFDRQRNEIKGAKESPAGLQHVPGETVYARWKFKLDAGFTPSSRFTHLMQIKPFDGDADLPIITLTARAGNPDRLEVRHSAGQGAGSLGEMLKTDLAPFKGTWVEVLMEFKNAEGEDGAFTVIINRVSDGATLLSLTRTGIDMWREGTTFNRLKWGIYRGLDDALRDEEVRFADFCISETSASECAGNGDVITDAGGEETGRAGESMIHAYPNPAAGTVTIEYEVKQAGAVRVVLASATDSHSTVLADRFVTAGRYRHTLQTDRLPAGVYLVKLYNNGKLYVHKLVRQ